MLAELTHTWNKCRWVEIFNLKSWEKMKYTTRNNFKSNRTLNNQIFKQVEAHSVEFYTNKFEIPLKIKESESEDWSWNFSMLSERALYVKERRRRRSEEVGKIIKSAIMILQETTFLMPITKLLLDFDIASAYQWSRYQPGSGVQQPIQPSAP